MSVNVGMCVRVIGVCVRVRVSEEEVVGRRVGRPGSRVGRREQPQKVRTPHNDVGNYHKGDHHESAPIST